MCIFSELSKEDDLVVFEMVEEEEEKKVKALLWCEMY